MRARVLWTARRSNQSILKEISPGCSLGGLMLNWTEVAFDSVRSYGLQPARLLCPWDSLGKNPGVGNHSLLWGTFLTQGSNAHVLHCGQILYNWATWEAPKHATLKATGLTHGRARRHGKQRPPSQRAWTKSLMLWDPVQKQWYDRSLRETHLLILESRPERQEATVYIYMFMDWKNQYCENVCHDTVLYYPKLSTDSMQFLSSNQWHFSQN